jgi:hypothetical protein
MCGGRPPPPEKPKPDKALEAEKVARSAANAETLRLEKEKQTGMTQSKLYGMVGRRSLLAPINAMASTFFSKMGG